MEIESLHEDNTLCSYLGRLKYKSDDIMFQVRLMFIIGLYIHVNYFGSLPSGRKYLFSFYTGRLGWGIVFHG